MWPVGYQFMRTRGKSNDRELCTACEHDGDSSLEDDFSESAKLYPRVRENIKDEDIGKGVT